MNRPCVRCGELVEHSPCAECHAVLERDRHRRQPPQAHVAYANGTRWKNFSKQLRRLSPLCEWCGSIEQLTVDHIIPVSEAPELVYVLENCRVLCRSCNSSRQNNVTDAERAEVAQRIADRRPGGGNPTAILHRCLRYGPERLLRENDSQQGGDHASWTETDANGRPSSAA